MTHIKRREYISLDSIKRIFRVLDYDVDDILELIDEEDGLLDVKRIEN